MTFSQLEKKIDILYPEYLICSNGTEIYHYSKEKEEYELDLEWDKRIMINWDSKEVLKYFNQFEWLTPNYNSPHDSKSLRFYATLEDLNKNQKEFQSITNELAEKGIFISVVYSGHDAKKMVDINAREASKGNAALYLMKRLNFQKENTFGFGDSNNDLDLLKKCGKGILVGNAQKELVEMYNQGNFEDNIIVSKFRFSKALHEELKQILG